MKLKHLRPGEIFASVAGYSGSKVYAWLFTVITIVALFGIISSAALTVISGFADGYFGERICLNAKCVANFMNFLAPGYQIMSATVGLLVAISTIGGIFVALSSYLSSSSASAFGNHIAHLNIFQSYLSSEVAKRSRISPVSVDIYFWYQIIFPDAATGRITVADSYKEAVGAVAAEVNRSNDMFSKAASGDFRYKDHQARMIDALARLGVKVEFQPRIDFYEAESQILSLVRAVNFAFCKNDDSCLVPQSIYR